MTVKRFTLVLALLALLTAAVSADDKPAPKGYAFFGRWISGPEALFYNPIVQEATGLEGDDLRAALQDGSSISELIGANGGAIDAVIADLVAQAADEFNARAAAQIESLEERFKETMNESHRRRSPWWRRRNPVRQLFGAWNMDETITAATGLDKPELNIALLEGATIAGLIEANDGDIAATVSALVEHATQGINEAAAARIERYEEAMTEAVDADFSDTSGLWRKWRPRHGAFFSFRAVYDSNQPKSEESSQQTEALGELEDA